MTMFFCLVRHDWSVALKSCSCSMSVSPCWAFDSRCSCVILQVEIRINAEHLAGDNVSEELVKQLKKRRAHLKEHLDRLRADLSRLQAQARRQRLCRIKRCVNIGLDRRHFRVPHSLGLCSEHFLDFVVFQNLSQFTFSIMSGWKIIILPSGVHVFVLDTEVSRTVFDFSQPCKERPLLPRSPSLILIISWHSVLIEFLRFVLAGRLRARLRCDLLAGRVWKRCTQHCATHFWTWSRQIQKPILDGGLIFARSPGRRKT